MGGGEGEVAGPRSGGGSKEEGGAEGPRLSMEVEALSDITVAAEETGDDEERDTVRMLLMRVLTLFWHAGD